MIVMNLNILLKNLRKGSGENEAISQLTEFRVDRNNFKRFERCNELSGYMIKAELGSSGY